MFNTDEIVEIIEVIKAFVPFADEMADAILDFGPAVKRVVDAVFDYSVEKNVSCLNDYVGAGLTRDEALALILANQINLKEIIKINKQ